MSPKKRFYCKCGSSVTPNTLKVHLRFACSLELEEKNRLIGILDIKTKHQGAWLVSLGKEARLDYLWHESVWNGNSKVNDWRFDSPRVLGANPPSVTLRLSKGRLGACNPSITSKTFNYSKTDLIKTIRKEISIFIKSDSILSIKDTILKIEYAHPFFAYMLAEDLPGVNIRKKIFMLALNIGSEKIVEIFSKKRGIAISKGLRASPHAMEMASLMASKLGGRRITIPHKILYVMVKSLDCEASFEFGIKDGKRSKSYDVYSPKKNILIEMHGRVWHDINHAANSSKNMLEKVNRNIKNDIVKKKLAKNRGFRFKVFWDDKLHLWGKALEKIYGKCPIAVKDAKDKIDSFNWDKKSL